MEYPGYTVTLRRCGDCAALPGYPHTPGCDVARCPLCGTQRLQCYDHERSKTPSIWTGIWPGEVECAELDMWTKFVYADDGKLVDYTVMDLENRRPCKWVTTTADDPDRSPDLNGLMALWARGVLVWNRKLQRYVKADYEVAA